MFKILLSSIYKPNDVLGGYQFCNGVLHFASESEFKRAANVLTKFYGCTIDDGSNPGKPVEPVEPVEPAPAPDKESLSLKADTTKASKAKSDIPAESMSHTAHTVNKQK